MLWFLNYVMSGFMGGPKIFPMNININLQKCMMPFYVIGLMIYF